MSQKYTFYVLYMPPTIWTVMKNNVTVNNNVVIVTKNILTGIILGLSSAN